MSKLNQIPKERPPFPEGRLNLMPSSREAPSFIPGKHRQSLAEDTAALQRSQGGLRIYIHKEATPKDVMPRLFFNLIFFD